MLELRAEAYERQLAQLREQVAQVDDLKAELTELRERLGLNSNHSSKPPSIDPPHSPRKDTNESTGRGRGKQHGQKGFGRKLKSIHQVDHIIDLRPLRCKNCDHLLMGEDAHPARHQVSEVVRPTVTITEYRQPTLRCLVCGAANQASWPGDIPASSFGPRAQAIIAYQTGRLGNSHRSTVNLYEVMGKLIDAGLSEEEARESIDLLNIEIISFDTDQAHLAAALRPTTKKLGLSLGDRSCLALGLARRHTVVTAEREWAKLRVGIKIELIR